MENLLTNPWIVGIGVTVIGGLILHYVFGIGRAKREKTQPIKTKGIPFLDIDTSEKKTNIVANLVTSLPNNKDVDRLYEELYKHAKKWSSDAKLVGSRIYIDFERNHCTYHIIGIIDSQIRHERKKLWVPNIYEVIEEQNFGGVSASKKLTDYRNWKLAIIKVLESTASDIEKLEKCSVQILPIIKDLSISIFFEKLPRKWSRHFEFKDGVLYQGENVIYKIN